MKNEPERLKVVDIVKNYLAVSGFDGLYYGDCGCRIDDLAPCGHINESCRAGYNQGPRDGLDWWIGPGLTLRCPHCKAVVGKDDAECLECGGVTV